LPAPYRRSIAALVTDTIFALSSGALPAAIAIVRVSGPGAEAAAERLAGSLPEPRQAALRRLRAADGAIIDEALLLRFQAPHTATGEPLVELHLHGGRAVVARVLAELASLPGLREAEPGAFTRRALLNGRIDLTEAEGLGELLSAETEWQRRAAVESAGGALRRLIEAWRDRLVLLAARAEAAIDYVDDEETELDLTDVVEGAEKLASEWRKLLDHPRSELLSEGLRVVLAGPPNSGKSSLFNALVGSERAIVTPIAGTTRDLIEARLDLDGIPILLIDTAGLRDAHDEVERIGIDRAARALSEADILLWLGAPDDAPQHCCRLLVHAKADLGADPSANSLATSAVTGAGLGDLRHAIHEAASALLPPPNRAAFNRRQAAALSDAHDAIGGVRASDLLLTAEALRQALAALDRLSGRYGTEDVLDAVFTKFCLGK
jgi:tRNA modification GTPase